MDRTWLVYTIEFADGAVEWWHFPGDADLDATAGQVEALIKRREGIAGQPRVVKTSRAVGLVYTRTGPAVTVCAKRAVVANMRAGTLSHMSSHDRGARKRHNGAWTGSMV